MFDIGESLAAARRAQGLELADVEALTRIRQRNLAALEAERFDVLPGRAYSRAFLRSYATALGLDADRFVGEFELRYPEPVEEDVPAFRPAKRRRRFPARVFLVLAALAGAIAFVAWNGNSNNASLPPLAAPSTANAAPPLHVTRLKPALLVPAKQTAAPAALVIRALSGDCWLYVRRGGPNGPVLYEATLRQGQAVTFGPHVWIRFGAPWNVAAHRGATTVPGLPASRHVPVNLTA